MHLRIEGKKRALDTLDQGLARPCDGPRLRRQLRALLQRRSDALLTVAKLLVWTHTRLLRAILCGKLLRTSPKLLLESNVSCALHGRHEPREIPLLFLDERDALFLQPQGCVEQLVHVLLVRLASSSHLQPELLPGVPLLSRQLIESRREAGVGLLQLLHLPIGQSDPVLRYLGGAFAELLLQGRPIGIRKGAGDRLCASNSRTHDECDGR
jgi:hypothetical protein